MKKLLGVLSLSIIVLVPVVSSAAMFRAGDQVSVNASERVADNLYMTGGTVTSAGIVAGDLFAGGGTIIVSGGIGGDLAATGGNITVLAPVTGDTRLAGGTIVVQSAIGGDLLIGGGQITVGGAGIKGDATIAGGTVRIDAPVSKNLIIRGGSIYINAPIAGKVDIEADTVTLGSAAVISGDLIYKATKEYKNEGGAVVRGRTEFTPSSPKIGEAAVGAGILFGIFSAFLFGKFLVLLACALVIGLVFQRYSAELVTRALSKPLFELGRGLLVMAALPVISVLLLITILGIPFGILGILAFVSLILFSWIITPIVVGSVVFGYFTKREYEVSWKTILVGVVVYSIAGLIPFFGWLLQTIACLITLGAIVAMKLDVAKQWR